MNRTLGAIARRPFSRLLVLLLALLVPALLPSTARAVTSIVLPYSEHAPLPGAYNRWGGSGSDNSPYSWELINEPVPGGTDTNDAIYTFGASSSVASYDLTSPAVPGPVDGGSIGINVRTGNTNTINYALYRANGSSVASGSLATTSTATNYSIPFTTHINAADATGLYIELVSPNTGVSIYAVSVSLNVNASPFTTVVPNGDKSVNYSDWGYWGGVSAPLYRNFDEVVPGGVNATDISYTYNVTMTPASFELATTTSALTSYVKLGVATSSNTAGFRTLTLRKSDGTVVLSGAIKVTDGHGAPINYIGAHAYLSQADLDGLYLQAEGATGVSLFLYAASVDVTTATVSGNVGTTSLCNGTTPIVGIAVNGNYWDDVPCQAGTGNWAAAPTFAAGDIVTAYLNGAAQKSVYYTRTAASSSTPITGVALYDGEVHVRSLSGTPITATDIDRYDADDDADIPVQYPVGGKVQMTGTTGFVVDAGTFTPGASVNAPRFWVRSTGTYDAGSYRMEVTSSGTGVCTNGTSARPFCVVGTFTPGTGTVSYQGTSGYEVSNGTYAGLEVTSTTSNTIQLGTSASGAINATSLLVTGSGGSPTISTSTYSPVVAVTGNTTVDGTATLGGSGTGSLTIAGDLTGTGRVNFTAGSVLLSNSATNTTLNASGTLPGTAWQFATLRTQNTGFPQRTVTVPATSREIRASVLLAADLYAALDAAAMTQPVTVTGDLAIAFGSSITSPPLLEVQGNFTNSGTFYPQNGTVRLTGSGTTATSWTVGNFYKLEVPTPGKVVTMANNFTVTNDLTIAGGTCATPATLRSSSPGTPRTLTRSGATTSVAYASFRDITITGGAVTASNSGDLGNNSNITFPGTPCSAPTTPYTDALDASAGSTRPTMLDARGPFHMSFVNASGTTADRYRTDVSTTLLDSSVVGLWALDGNGTDRSATANAQAQTGGVAYTSSGGFGQAATFDGVNDQMSAPTNAAYATSTFTVDLWFKTNSQPTNFPTMVSRANSTQAQFQIAFNRANGTLVADATTGSGFYEIATPSARWLDNSWHHVAMTADSSKRLRLYVDGVQYGSTVTYAGTLHQPAAPVYIGGSQGYGTNFFGGQIDDVQFRNVVLSDAEIAGYAATGRPHAQSVWQTTGYSGTQGTALSGSCAAGVRCPDTTFGGTSIQREGARYYATHQLRTTAGLWSAPVSDWFETRDGIVVTAPGTVALGTVVGGATATGSFAATTTCTNGTGCALYASTVSDGVAMSNPSGSLTIPPNATGAPVAWPTGGAAALGFTVLGSTNGKNTATWGTGTNFSDLSMLNWTGAGMAGTLLVQTSAPGSEVTSIGVRLDAGTTTPAAYSGSVNVIAIDAP